MSGTVGPRLTTVIDPLFKMTVDTTKAGQSPSDSYRLKLRNGTTNMTVYWGDGTNDLITVWNQAQLTHQYPVGGTYQITLDGLFYGFDFVYTDERKLSSIDNWGANQWGNMSGAFYGCSNMVGNYTDTPDTSLVTSMSNMFRGCTNFNSPVNFETSNVTSMANMFWLSTSFNQSVEFDTTKVTTINDMFRGAISFNQPVNFNAPALIDASRMFLQCNFNSSITITNSTLLENCTSMFGQMQTTANPTITLDTTSVTNMLNMFSFSRGFNSVLTFNGGTSNVLNMGGMFSYCLAFDQPVNFDTSSVTNMFNMFFNARVFNQSVSSFDTSNVENMQAMFSNAYAFNQSVSNFNTVKVVSMVQMFYLAQSFNQDLSGFNITALTNATNFLSATPFSTTNYDKLLISWDAQPHNNSVPFHAGSACYSTSATTAHNSLALYDLWSFTDGGACEPSLFMMTIDTTQPGSASDTFVIPLQTTANNFVVDWGDGISQTVTTVTSVSHTYTSGGTYQVTMDGAFSGIRFIGGGDRLKLSSIDQWGTNQWEQMAYAFYGCNNMVGNYIDDPDTSLVTNMYGTFQACTNFNSEVNFDMTLVVTMKNMFYQCTNFNQPINFNAPVNTTTNWMFHGCSTLDNPINITSSNLLDNTERMFQGCGSLDSLVTISDTSGVLNMANMFYLCSNLNKTITLDTSNVMSMLYMFAGCNKLNQPIIFNDTSNVTNMFYMFDECHAFNQPINFNTIKVISLGYMFDGCKAFNQPINFNAPDCTSMIRMFYQCIALDKPINITSSSLLTVADTAFKSCTALGTTTGSVNISDTSGMVTVSQMFYNCNNLDPDVSGWNISGLTNASSMMALSSFSTANYDSMLVAWEGQPHNDNVNFHAGTACYTTGSTAETAFIDLTTPVASGGDGWVIGGVGACP